MGLNIDIELLPTQEEFIFSQYRFPAFVGGFGAGKTHALVIRSLLGIINNRGLDRAYFAPTHDLINLIAIPRFEAVLDAWKVPYSIKGRPPCLHVGPRDSWGKIIFRTLEVPERIVGFEVADAEIDEMDTLKEDHAMNCWRRIIARARQPKPDGAPNTVSVGTTPEGFRATYQLFVAKPPSADYKLYRARTAENVYLSQAYIDGLMTSYPPQLRAAYLEGMFVNLTSGSVHPDFDREKNGCDVTMTKDEPLHVGMDFNINNMHAIISVIRDDKPFTVSELTGIRDTPAMAELIDQKFGDTHKIHVYPDASGNRRYSSNASQESDHAILRDKKFVVHTNTKNPPPRDRVNAMNAMICNMKGERRWRINTKLCPVATEALEKQAYDRNGEPDKTTGFDHSNEAVGYFIAARYPIVRPVTDTKIGFAD